MKYVRVFRFIFLALVIFLFDQPLLPDNGQMPGTHIDVWLRNVAGDRIMPSSNAYDPYSPKKTCGACHQYFTISQGDHFQQGFPATGSQLKPSALPPGLIPDDLKITPYTGSGFYDWIAANSQFHPGGGLLEQVRPEAPNQSAPAINLVEGEQLNSGMENHDFQSTLTSDSRSHFRTSGVVEADCLICHMEGYSLEKRNAQIKARNYQWAASSGAGLGEIEGQVWTPNETGGVWNFSKRPAVKYNWETALFNSKGMLSGKVIGARVASSACLQCHGDTQAFHTGTLHRAEDSVHARAGFQCSDCHSLATDVPGGRLSHRIGRNASAGSAEKTGMKTCAGCHLGDLYRTTWKGMPGKAPNPLIAHADIFHNSSFHLRLLSCTACHVSSQPARGVYLLDISTGKTFWYTADKLDAITSPDTAIKPVMEPWNPWIAVVDLKGTSGERYVPAALHTAQWFGEKSEDGRIRPIDLQIVLKAFRKSKGITVVEVKNTAGEKVSRPTVATQEDIEKMLKALQELGRTKAVFVSDKIYEHIKGKIVSSKLPFENTITLPVWHNISPIAKKQTLGALGCTDCHEKTSPFFTKLKVRNIGRFLAQDYPTPKKPNASPQMQDWGYRRVPSHD
jgi:hypothetical protein